MEKGQKVFGALYDWMLQEYQRQGVTKGKDLVLPVRTVWGWYMQEQGLQNGQRVDESETGHGLMCIVSNAACIRREVPKVDRLVVMSEDDVHPTFRVRAEQWIGEEVVYICDVANHPTDVERVAICAVPRSFIEPLMPSEKNEGIEPEQEKQVEFISQSELSVIADEIAPEVLSHGVNEDIEALDIKCSITLPSTQRENKPKPKEPSLFDDFLFEFAKHCTPTTGYVHRSRWSGEMVCDVKEGDVLTIFYVGVLVLAIIGYWIGMAMVDAGASYGAFLWMFFSLLGGWTLLMLWFNHRVDEIKKGRFNS